MVKWGKQQDPVFEEADGNGYLVASYTFDVINDPKRTGVRERVIKIETNGVARAKASINGIQQFWSDKIEERFGVTQSQADRSAGKIPVGRFQGNRAKRRAGCPPSPQGSLRS